MLVIFTEAKSKFDKSSFCRLQQLLNIPVISLQRRVSKEQRFNSLKFRHPSNMADMSITCVVLKDDRSNLSSFLQLRNIEHKLTALDVLMNSALNSFKLWHSPKKYTKSVASEVSTPLKSTFTKDSQFQNIWDVTFFKLNDSFGV